jgi:hypothetical protein
VSGLDNVTRHRLVDTLKCIQGKYLGRFHVKHKRGIPLKKGIRSVASRTLERKNPRELSGKAVQ